MNLQVNRRQFSLGAIAAAALPRENAQAALSWRVERLLALQDDLVAQAMEIELCRRDKFRFFTWCWTYDPRLVPKPAHVPFDLFVRQRDMVDWFDKRIELKEDGLLEKSRDVGFTWVAGGCAFHKWRFVPGFKTTFGSRKAELVDKIGDPDSIFEKIRLLYRSLPPWLLPEGFRPFIHDRHMLLLNPRNGNTIRGEAGDEMGRGGRSTVYIVDEAAFIEHAERVESATSANADVRIWASSVNGMDNLFARKRFGGQMRPDQIFRFHYKDDPRKDADWERDMRGKTEPHSWASNYDIDYSASVEGICIPAAWVEAAKKIASVMKEKNIALLPLVEGVGGGDVGAGKAKSVFVSRFGPIVLVPVSWGDPDTIDTAHKMLDEARAAQLTRPDGHECKVKYLRYDSVGVGHGIAAIMKRNPRRDLVVTGVNTGQPPTDTRWPDGETSQEKFANLKAESWWTMRGRFKLTYDTFMFLTGQDPDGRAHPSSDLISLPDDTAGPQASALATQLSCVKWHRNEKGKILMESKISLAKRGVASPDHADALALTFCSHGKAEAWAKLGKSALMLQVG